MHESILTYSDAWHEDDTFKKTPLQWAVENHDIFSLIEFLRLEKEYHQEQNLGLYCLKEQLTNDLNLNLAISEFSGLYDKSQCDQRMEALPILIPLWISFIQYCIDVRSDILLSLEYHNFSMKELPNETDCSDWHNRNITQEMYGKAFTCSSVFASSSLVASLYIVLTSKMLRNLCKKLWKRSKWRFALLMLLSWCPPLFLFTIYLIYSYRHSIATKKSKERADVEQAEFLWNTVDTVEAGFEASGEILLQIWLLGPNIMELTDITFQGFINGILVSEGATNTASIAKIIFAMISIMYGVGECYRVQKREAVNMFFDIIPIYVSVLLQVIARVIAFSIFFSSSQGSHGGETILFFTIHIILVFAIRLRFSRQWRKVLNESDNLKKYEFMIRLLIEILNAFLSCLVYIELRPPPTAYENRPPLKANERKMRKIFSSSRRTAEVVLQ